MNLRTVIVVILFLALPSCIYEDLDDCGVCLEFVFDYNMEYADLFRPQVGEVDVFLFDSSGKYLLTQHAGYADLHGGNRMFPGGLPYGDYRILTLGKFSDYFRFTDMEDAGFVVGVTTIEETKLRLCHRGEVEYEFPDLWFGTAVNITHRSGQSVWPVSLLRLTNRFDITLCGIDTQAGPFPYTVEIVAPEEGAYDYRNYPLTPGRLVYRPYLSEHDTEFRINTMRLFENEKERYSLVIRNGETGDELWSCDLIRLLKNAKPENRPDGTTLPLQEYLDRRGEWEIVILYDDMTDDGFVATRILVNGWIVWEYGMDI